MLNKYLTKILVFIIPSTALIMLGTQSVYAQVSGSIPQEIKWLTVSSLHSWFSSGGAEIEYGRRGRGQYETIDQIDGLGWPAEYGNRVYTSVGNSIWIGTTNFADPVSGETYPYKVVSAGRRFMYLGSEIFPEDIKLIGRFNHSTVIVDDVNSALIEFTDEVDEIDPTIPSDRMMVNVVHTPIGITLTRKIYAFTNQYHDNYYIYENTFKNTGIINNSGATMSPRTLTDVVFFWQHRYALACEAYRGNWALNGTNWGKNTILDVVGQNYPNPNWDGTPYEFRASFAYYGPHSSQGSFTDGVGFPRMTDGSIMSGTQYAGVVTLHADKSATDKSDDLLQPFNTAYNGADQGGFAQGQSNQFNPDLMTNKYLLMTGREQNHPTQTWAQALGRGTADQVTVDAGGYQAGVSYGPYNLAPGDSITIIYAEGVSGINRDLNKEITRKWFTNTGPFVLPDGSTTTDRSVYKETWVFSGKDSLFQTFRRAISNYSNGNGFTAPVPPPPPDRFEVRSGGNKISLTWSNNAETWPNFNGYQVYRAEGRTDTTWEMVFSCDRNNAQTFFDDKTAKRGFNYYYYVVTKDDGSTNDIQPGIPLVSSKFYTMTNREANLTRPPGNSLSEIRVVPNPYNLKMRELQFGLDTPDRLAFYGLPPRCMIRIYTETGDLIETIDHNNGSGDELWHSLTSSSQLVASGLYIAYFEVTEDYTDDTGQLLFRKGENTFRKFIIIR
jgi:hypothetical protein